MTPTSRLSQLIKLQLSSRHAAQNTTDGFTLTELMVTLAIVGILSAVALPNFLSQSDKAKASEAKQTIASGLKQAQAQFVEDGAEPQTAASAMNARYGTPENETTLFNYSGQWSSPIYMITAVGNNNDAGLKSKTLKGCANFTTGKVRMQSLLDEEKIPNCL